MTSDRQLRIGLSSRITPAVGYDELRDSLAHDWIPFLEKVLPGAIWQTLPNEGGAVVERIKKWGLNGLILTGGNDIGEYPIKDETDRALLAYALEHGIPVFGVCRGLQVMAHFFNIPLSPCLSGEHIGRRHRVNILSTSATQFLNAPQALEVNSYHAYTVQQKALTGPLEMLGVGDDGTVEAITVSGRHAAAVMWHPERDIAPDDFTVRLIRWVFGMDCCA